MRLLILLAATTLAFGCGNSTSTPTIDAGAGADAALTPTNPTTDPTGRSWSVPPLETNVDGGVVAARLPRIVNRGGPFLRNPRIVTVTFKNDDPAIVARVETFASMITKTNWWREVTDSYCAKPDDCIGEARSGTHARLDDVLPNAVTDSEVDVILAREGQAGHLGPLGPDALIMVYLPKGIAFSTAAAKEYCKGKARAIHRSVDIGQKKIPYAILPRCGSEAELTGTASHELLETTTNPNPTRRGFAFEGDPEALGFYASGLEPVDPCGLLTMDEHWSFESGFVVHRAWSNRQAALGHDPCVPARGNRAYVALVPKKAAIRLSKVGESVTVEVDAFADRVVPKWAASVFDLTGYQEGEQFVDVAIDKSTIGAGETAKVTITCKKMSRERSTVAIVSSLGVHSTMWPLAIVMR